MNAGELATQANQFISTYILPFGWKIAGAIALWIIGGWAIGLLRNALNRALIVRHVDPTLSRYLQGSANALLKLLLVIAIFSVLGIETTSFAALLAGVGLAIGAAWAGLLGNFAAGLFILLLRPFEVGDTIAAGDLTGIVRAIGLFTTRCDTEEGVRVHIGNSKLFSENIRNFSTNPYRRVNLTMRVPRGTHPAPVMKRVAERVARFPNVMTDPAPVVEILEIGDTGAIVAVRPFCHHDHYWQVYFDTTRMLADVVAELPPPPPPVRA
jgi:small conductance mechanosensitive channel